MQAPLDAIIEAQPKAIQAAQSATSTASSLPAQQREDEGTGAAEATEPSSSTPPWMQQASLYASIDDHAQAVAALESAIKRGEAITLEGAHLFQREHAMLQAAFTRAQKSLLASQKRLKSQVGCAPRWQR